MGSWPEAYRALDLALLELSELKERLQQAHQQELAQLQSDLAKGKDAAVQLQTELVKYKQAISLFRGPPKANDARKAEASTEGGGQPSEDARTDDSGQQAIEANQCVQPLPGMIVQPPTNVGTCNFQAVVPACPSSLPSFSPMCLSPRSISREFAPEELARVVSCSRTSRYLSSCGTDLMSSFSRVSSKTHPDDLLDLVESDDRFTLLESWTKDNLCSRPSASWETVSIDPPSRRTHRRKTSESVVPPLVWFWNRCMLHPTSRWRVTWDILSVLFVAYDVILVPMSSFLDLPHSPVSWALLWASGVFWTLDILASFLTGRHIGGNLEMRPRVVAKSYALGWLLPDLVILVAQWLSTAAHEHCLTSGGCVMAALGGARALRLLRMLRLLKVQMVLYEIGARFNSSTTLALMGLVKIITYTAVGLHFIACSWYGLGTSSSGGWVHEYRLQENGVLLGYMASLHWALAQFCSSSDIQPTNSREYAFANAVICLGFVLFCYVVGAVTTAMSHLQQLRATQVQQQQVLCGYLKRYRVSPALSVRVKSHFEMHCKQKKEDQSEACEAQAVLSVLPLALQMDILEEVRAPVLGNYRFLYDVSEENPRLMRQLCHEALSEVTANKREVVFTAGDVCNRVLFVTSGQFCYKLLRRPASRSPKVTPKPTPRQSPPATGSTTSNSSSRLCPPGGPADDVCRSVSREDFEAKTEVAVNGGQWVSEAALWTLWEYCGEFMTVVDSTLLALDTSQFSAVISRHVAAYYYAARYARIFVRNLNRCEECSDVLRFIIDRGTVESESEYDLERVACHKSVVPVQLRLRRIEPTRAGHFVFISHHKADAGTEAALMQAALERMILEEPDHPGGSLKAPVFLDSEDLTDLRDLKEHVRNSRNLVLLLTSAVFTRPWVLVEIVTAQNAGLHIVPVEVQKKDVSFDYPDEAYFERLRTGRTLDSQAMKLLRDEGIELEHLEKALRMVFSKIAVPFSPHKSSNVRDAELADILKRCQE